MTDGLITVEEALGRILATASAPLGTERVPLSSGSGRTLAVDLGARRSQPPADVSAMDGYAVRAADLRAVPATLRLVGVSAAGRPFADRLEAGDCARIFTGAALPAGADTVLMQENARAEGNRVTALQSEPEGRNVRRAGLDFMAGEVPLRRGRRLGASEIALAASMNHAELPVVRRPRVGILSTGDELVPPGSEPGPGQIVASNGYAVAAIVASAGGEPVDLGIAADTQAALAAALERASGAALDVLVTLGGASVGEHDLVRGALGRAGMALSFWKVALRPGKPLMHGTLGALRVLGLPGNPVSTIVCGVLFLRPLIRALSGDTAPGLPLVEPALLGAALPANGDRQDFMRATLEQPTGALPVVTAASIQDSSMLKVLAGAQALIVRPPFHPPQPAGAPCGIMRLESLCR